MAHADIADALNVSIDAWENLPESKRTRDSQAFIGVNNNIRRALQVLEDEDPTDVEALEAKGLWTGHYDDPIPGTFVPAARELVDNLRATD